MKKQTKSLMLLLLLNCALFISVYFVLASLSFPVHYVYIAAGVLLGFGFVIYNRGFSGKGVTPDMLPDTMTAQEKENFLQDSKQRLERSRWVLTILIPVILSLALDMMYLFLLPTVQGMLS